MRVSSVSVTNVRPLRSVSVNQVRVCKDEIPENLPKDELAFKGIKNAFRAGGLGALAGAFVGAIFGVGAGPLTGAAIIATIVGGVGALGGAMDNEDEDVGFFEPFKDIYKRLKEKD